MLYIGKTQKELENVIGTGFENIPFSNCKNYEITFGNRSGSLFAVKTEKGKSLRTLISEQAEVSASESCLAGLRENMVRLDQLMNGSLTGNQREGYKELFGFLDQPDFCGIVLFQTEINIKEKSAAGVSVLFDMGKFYVPLAVVSSVNFPQGKGADFTKAVFRGYAGLENSVTFCSANGEYVSVENGDIFFRQGEFLYSGLSISFSPGSIFGGTPTGGSVIHITGGYERLSGQGKSFRYRFVLSESVPVFLAGGCIYEMLVKSLEASLEPLGEDAALSVKLAGSVLFSKLSDTFDPFSFGIDLKEEAPGMEGLPFAGLTMNFMLKKDKTLSFSRDYSRMASQWEKSVFRKNSFRDAFSFQNVSFVNYQNQKTPKSQGFQTISAPYPQGNLPEEWYGLIFRLQLMEGISLEILFAYGTKEGKAVFYAGARILAYGKTGDFGITVAGLFRIGFSSAAISKNAGNALEIRLKGLSVGMMGLKFPNAGCDIALLSGREPGGNQVNAWYGVYDNRKEKKA